MLPDIAARRQRFRELHASGCFVIPNAWDAGTAKYLEHLGFPALATTSAGLSFAHGVPDGALAAEATLTNARQIVEATTVPVNVDFEAGYAFDIDQLAINVQRCIETGAAGLSIEDSTGNPAQPLFDRATALERFRAARRAVDASGAGVLLTARSECFLTGHASPLAEAIARLQSFAEAGADVLYAPGLSQIEDIRAVVKAVHPKPVNFLMSRNLGLRIGEVAELGVRRISVGSSLARAAWGGFLRAAREIAGEGSFTAFDQAEPFADLNQFFRDQDR